eukprot:jgi/Antlo1/2562/2186
MLFLLHHWGNDMEFGAQSLEYAKSVEQKIVNFLSFCEAREKVGCVVESTAETGEVVSLLEKTKYEVHKALCNNVDTRKAVLLLSDLVSSVHKRAVNVDGAVLAMIGSYVAKMCRIFGLLGEERTEKGMEFEIAHLLCNFRKEVRKFARERRPYPELYQLCDNVREELKRMDYIIEDSGTSSIVRRRA